MAIQIKSMNGLKNTYLKPQLTLIIKPSNFMKSMYATSQIELYVDLTITDFNRLQIHRLQITMCTPGLLSAGVIQRLHSQGHITPALRFVYSAYN
jgi:hypothetical protein